MHDSYDVIVLGSGAGGMTAAAVAATHGLRVILIEKTRLIGGTTAISGGMTWIPANSKMAAAGISDSRDEAARYLALTVGKAAASQNLQAFLDNCDRAVRYLEEHTSVRLRPVQRYPDYYPDLAGATLGGRVLEPVPFDGRELGADFALLRPALPEFMLFGGMMVDRADIPHFRRVGRSLSSTLRVARLTLRYAWQRLRAPRGTSLVLGNALAARLLHSLRRLGVTILVETVVRQLLHDGKTVVGVEAIVDGKTITIRAARGVVLATGGFSHNDALKRTHLPTEIGDSPANSGNTGDGIAFGQSAGAQFRRGTQGNAFWVPASRFRRRDGTQAIFPHTVTDRSKPGFIAVNRSGRRFTNEAQSYHEFVRAMLKSNSGDATEAFAIVDRVFLWKYGLGAIKPFTVSLQNALHQGYLLQGASVGELAGKLNIDPAALTDTIALYNDGAKQGRDPQFGRGENAYQRHLGDANIQPNPCVAPIVAPPFYAIKLYPADLGTAAGLATDAVGRVLDARDAPIAGLYACGNDMASIMEGAYPGPGITLGPALTFGFLVGEALAASLPRTTD